MKTNLQQWKHSADVLDWFEYIKNKKTFTFIKFKFYINISKDLLMKSIEFSKNYVNISSSNIDIIVHLF